MKLSIFHIATVLTLVLCASVVHAQIISTTDGGLWTEASTWEGGNVPGESDTVYLQGVVQLDTSTNCSSLMIYPTGQLTNLITDSYSLEVFGAVINQGVIRDEQFNLYLKVAGDIQNEGEWSNFYTSLTGTEHQAIVTSQPFEGKYLINTNQAGYIIVSDRLQFIGTNLDMNNDTLCFSDSLFLSFDGGYMDQARIIWDGTGGGRLQFASSGNMAFQKSKFKADSVFLTGLVQYQSAPITFEGTIVLLDTLQNFPNSSYSATITGDFINYGHLIQKTFTNTIKISGDITNHAVWDINSTQLIGSTDQAISTTSPISSDFFQILKTGGNLTGNSDLNFLDTQLIGNNDTIAFTGGNQLSLSNCSFSNIVLKSQIAEKSVFNLFFTDNTALGNCHLIADTAVIYGLVNFYGVDNQFAGNITLSGDLMNLAGQSATIAHSGNFINNGSISDNNGKLTLLLEGNTIQNGDWSNQKTVLNSSDGQVLLTNSPLESDTLFIANAGAVITSPDNLLLNNVYFELNSARVDFPQSALLFLTNSFLTNGTLSGMLNEVSFTEESGCAMIEFPTTSFYGKPMLAGNVSFLGNFFNHAPITGNSYSPIISVEGDFSNFGSIDSISLEIKQNFHNSNSLITDSIYIAGSTDQQIIIQNDASISNVFLIAGTGNTFEWFKDGATLIGNDGFSGTDRDTLKFLLPLTDSLAGAYQCNTNEGWSGLIQIDTINNRHWIDARLLLEGPVVSGDSMQVYLQENGTLPLMQPYGTAPWYYAGNQEIQPGMEDDIVDWILMEFTEAYDISEAITTRPFWKSAVVLLDDGVILNENNELPNFVKTITDSVYVIFRHRNHLDIITSQGIIQENDTIYLNLISSATQVLGADSSLKEINYDGDSFFVMIAGDGNLDGTIDVSDKDQQWQEYAGRRAEYQSNDLNLDGQVNNIDKNDYWLPNLGCSSQIPLND